MQASPLGRSATAVGLALMLCTSFTAALAQNTYEDLEGRFALDLPEGWKMTQEQFNLVYQFGSDASSAAMMIVYSEGATDLEELFRDQVENLTGAGYAEPPPGSVVDMTLNGCRARWTEYASPMDIGGVSIEMFAYAAAVVSDEDQAGVGFLTFMNADEKGKVGEALRTSFETLRLHGRPLTGVSDVVSVDAAMAAKPPEPTGPSSFEHELVALDFPSGWSAEPGQGDILATISHDDYGSLTVMGSKGGDFGSDRDQILVAMRDGLLSSLPSMRPTGDAWETETAGGTTVVLEEYDGAITVAGTDIPYGAVIGAVKDGRRGLGFMGMFSAEVKQEAMHDMIEIIKSMQ